MMVFMAFTLLFATVGVTNPDSADARRGGGFKSGTKSYTNTPKKSDSNSNVNQSNSGTNSGTGAGATRGGGFFGSGGGFMKA